MSAVIHWFRRDLRLTDNTSLNAAIASGRPLVPVYILSQWKNHHHWTGPARQQFLCGCLDSLAANVEAKGGRLLIRAGNAVDTLEALIKESGATEIHFNRDPDPFGRATELKVTEMAARLGVTVHAHKDHAMHERDEVLTATGTPFRVFTPYSRAWLKQPKTPQGTSPQHIPPPPPNLASLPIPTLAHWGLPTPHALSLDPGEAAARKRLQHFLNGPLLAYGNQRDIPSLPGTSRLSQDLRYGLLSIREVLARCDAAAANATAPQRQNAAIYRNELIWREFYFQVLWHWPSVLDHEFQEKFRSLSWHPPGDAFTRWCEGQTGFPIIDAGMRQLRTTGFMHNRVRMITAMFLVKDLHISWKTGEQWFMQQLLDGEIASNNGGWQWSAGTGTDAAPYFRIQNPWSQTSRFDPEGTYIKHWVPELRDASAKSLCTPPATGLRLAKNYPLPIVDHAHERDVTLDMYRR